MDKKTSISCHPVRSPICQLGQYNYTMMPNSLGHTSQKEAATELRRFRKLLALKCGPELQPIMCRVLFPPCGRDQPGFISDPFQDTVQHPGSTRSALCRFIEEKCAQFIEEVGISWPENNLCLFDDNHTSGNGGLKTIHFSSSKWIKVFILVSFGFEVIRY